jgi:hypothetical protein
MEELRTPALPDDKVTQALALLPKQLSPIEQIKTKIQTLGAKYHRYLHQDEFGPTRAERMSALRLVLGELERLDILLLGLPQQLALDLMNDSERQSLRISHSGFILRSWTVERIYEVTSGEFFDRHAQRSADDRDLLQKIRTTAATAIELIAYLDTSSESELFVDAVRTGSLIGKNIRGVDVFHIHGAQLNHLKHQFSLTIDRLEHQRGPERQPSLWWLVWELCDLWTHTTGQPVTNSAIRKRRYTSRPESPAGRFVTAIVEIVQPSDGWIIQHLQPQPPVRAWKFAIARGHRARSVCSAMREYVKSHREPGPRRGRRPRAVTVTL